MRLHGRDLGGPGAGTVQTHQRQQVAAIVDDGDRDIPLVLYRFSATRGLDLLAVLQGEDGLGFHVFSSRRMALPLSMAVTRSCARPWLLSAAACVWIGT